jgi:lipoic acid synthetase
MTTKSGLMLGLGERTEEVVSVMEDLRAAGCDILTLGQYLQPTREHLPVERFVHPDEFRALKEQGRTLGFRHVESGPLVRSSYHAHEQV